MDRVKWRKVYAAMGYLLRTQQAQIQFLLKDRELLVDRIKLEHERWVSMVKFSQDQTAQMERELNVRDLQSEVEAEEWKVILGLKERDAYMLRDKLEKTTDELQGLRECHGILSSKCSEAEGVSDKKNQKEKNKSLMSELRRLKLENQQLSANKDSEISRLVREKSFIWNQYNTLENRMNEQLRVKCDQLDTANEKVKLLLKDNEELQTACNDLKNQMANMGDVLVKRNGEIARLSRELQMFKDKSVPATPMLQRCSTRSGNSLRETTTNGMKRKGVKPAVTVSMNPTASEKGNENSKRKRMDDTPKLFSSSFKIPKLKTPASQVG